MPLLHDQREYRFKRGGSLCPSKLAEPPPVDVHARRHLVASDIDCASGALIEQRRLPASPEALTFRLQSSDQLLFAIRGACPNSICRRE